MSVGEKVEAIEKMEMSTRVDLNAFCHNFDNFSSLLNKLTETASPPLADAMVFNAVKMGDVGASSGCPGTFQTAIEDTSAHIDQAFAAIAELSRNLRSSVANATRNAVSKEPEAKAAIADVEKNAAVIENIVTEMIPTIAKKAEKIQKKADKAIEKRQSGKHLRKLMDKVTTARRELAPSQHSMIDKGTRTFAELEKRANVVRDVCTERVNAMTNGFNAVKDEYSKFAQTLRNCGRSLQEQAAKIDFRSDFQEFVADTGLIRYDLECLPFESVDTSHPVFAGIDTRINVAVPPLYPLGLAKVVNSFAPENPNEIACTKGKFMLLMENADEPWVFVQNPVTNAMGYAPSACFEQVGDQIGVFIEQPDEKLASEATVALGDYVAIVGKTNEDKLAVVTTRGIATTVDSKIVGIITS